MTRRHMILLLIAALASTLPVFLFDVGGDILFHYVLIDCFGSGVWSGSLYPRWCFEADAGLGSPAFLFYFPLAYWGAALFYPMTWIGAGINAVHAMGCLLASIITAFAAYRWLRLFAVPGAALMGTVIYLYMPYRMEVLLYRSAYAEVWGLALLPYVLAQLAGAARGHNNSWQKLGLAFALLTLAHAPLAFVAAVGGAIYLAIAGTQSRNVMLKHYVMAGLVALTLTAFYLAPALYFRQFTHVEDSRHVEKLWANNHLSLDNITLHGQGRLVAAIGLTVLAASGLALRAYLGRVRIGNVQVRSEAAAWSVIMAVALFLLLPVSDPLWKLLKPIQFVALPWRMQALIAAGVAYFVALYGTHFLSERQLRTARGDAAGLIALMVLLSFFLLSMRDSEAKPMFDTILKTHHISPDEYRTRWTDDAFAGQEFVSKLGEGVSRVELISGSGVAQVEKWKSGRIIIEVKAFSPVSLRIAHRYFPIWQAQDATGAVLTLTPEAGSGWMLVELPTGTHRIILRERIWTGHWLVIAAALVSLLGWLAEIHALSRHAALRKGF